MRNRVHVLYTGYTYRDPTDPTSMRANCTCTLVRSSNGRNIIVDTMTAWDGDRISDALQMHELHPHDIHAVVCTHGHSDHIGCNYLFQNAQMHFVGDCVSHADKYPDWLTDQFDIVTEEITVLRTPGHTKSCVSVLVRNVSQYGGTVGICGDLFECLADIADPTIWMNAGSADQNMQRLQRLRMAELCAYIIPGHGPGFPVNDHLRALLRRQTMTGGTSNGNVGPIEF